MALKQRKKSIEEFVAEFRLLISLAGMPSETKADNLHLINYFQQSLHLAIAKKIGLSDNVPTTIAGSAERVIQYDTQYKMTMAMSGNNNDRTGSWKGSSFAARDKNTMDVNAMSMKKRATLMKQGLCFKCEERGHLARDCKKTKKTTVPPKETLKRFTPC